MAFLDTIAPRAAAVFGFIVAKILAPFADFMSRLVLTVLYFVLLTLPGMFVRFFQDPLGLRGRSGSNFVPKRNANPDLAHARRQG